ncbi:MAG: class I SAM-dependent methyltransferase [Candidatus Roizmanbacteria bacterium]|nr:MAG: class I SAM-dependent methyltransferase [Candidatus Roizmanbacteria bacterium]
MIKDNRINAILDFIPSNKVILDIGCAQNPEIHLEIAKKSKKTVGIDLNKKGINDLKKKGLEAYEMSAEEINLKYKFDYIIAGELIEHLNNPGLFIEGMIKHLKPDGKIIMTTPNISSILLYTLIVLFDKTQDPTHIFYFDKKNLEAFVSRYNLKIKITKYIPPEIKFLGDSILFKIIFFISTLIANIGFKINNRLFGSYLLVVLEK